MRRHERPLPTSHREHGYYGLPPLKGPHWDWKVSGYIAVAGVSGAAQALAWLGRLRDRRAFRGALRNARMLAVAGTAAGTALLIADLKTPRRFYNMLRILRPTSPMSLGTYILGAFGACSAVAALGEVSAARRRPALRRAADVAQAGAAFSGAGAATYTAALLAATSTPYWAAAPSALGAEVATSSLAGGAAVLALGERAAGRHRTAEQLESVAALASVAHLGASHLADRRRREVGVDQAMTDHPDRRQLRTADLVLAGAVPLAAYALSRPHGHRASAAAVVGSLAVLAGTWLVRDAMLRTGKASTRRPEAAFRLAGARQLPRPRRSRPLPEAVRWIL